VFHDVVVRRELTLKGGLLKKPMPMYTLEVRLGDGLAEFIRINRSQDWIARAVTGEPACRRGMQRIGLFDELSNKLLSAACGNEVGGGDDMASDDPMRNLDLMDATSVEVHTPTKKTPQRKKLVKKNSVVRLMFPEVAPESDPNRKSCCREVSVWFAGSVREVWLGVEHIPWCIKYMRAQFELGGVPLQPSVSSDSQSSSDSPKKTLKWSFAHERWEAVLTDGSKISRRVLKPRDVDETEAATVVAHTVSLKGLEYTKLKELAHDVLKAWLQMQTL
jgi:hypothetical protein